MTNEELLNAWNTGNEVTVVQMGGLGPSYEQALYVVMFLFLAEFLKKTPNFGNILDVQQRVREIESLPHIVHALDKIGPSEAMIYSAWNAASMFTRFEYEGAMAKASANRVIKVSKVTPDNFIEMGI